MTEGENIGRRFVLFVVLLGATALFATTSIVNVTYWHVNTTHPLVKYAGNDTYIMYGTFVRTNWYYDSATGLNITRIFIAGVPGDIVNTTNALRVCNNYNVPVKVRISGVSLLQDFYPNNIYIKYMAVKIVDPSGATDNKVEIKDEAVVDATTDYVTITPNRCAVLGVDLVIDANAPHYRMLASYQINIEQVPQ